MYRAEREDAEKAAHPTGPELDRQIQENGAAHGADVGPYDPTIPPILPEAK